MRRSNEIDSIGNKLPKKFWGAHSERNRINPEGVVPPHELLYIHGVAPLYTSFLAAKK